MRILRITSDIYPYVMGGVGVHTHAMSNLQSEYGHQVTVVTVSSDDADNRGMNRFNQIVLKPNLNLFGNRISFRLPSVINREMKECDIVHAHSHLFFSTNVAALLRKLKIKPLVITNHGLYSQTAPQRLQKIYMKLIGIPTLKAADKIICYNEVEKEKLINLGIVNEKVAVINNGVDTSQFTPIQEERRKELLWVGRYVPGKGVDVLIRGFSEFLKGFPDYRLIMIGSGPMKKEMMSLIEECGIGQSVDMIESVPNEEIPEIYRRVKLFLLPSVEEGVPRSILESMACGTPVVCSELPQLKDIVEGSGVMFKIRDHSDMADCMTRLTIENDLWLRCSKNARDRAVKDFSWRNTVEETILLYEKIIEDF